MPPRPSTGPFTQPFTQRFTQPWADAFREAIERDTTYRDAAKTWSWPVALVVTPDAEHGVHEPTATQLDLMHGRCSAAVCMPADRVTAPFVLTAPMDVWNAVLAGEVDVVQAIARGRIAVRGSLATLMMHAKGAAALVACARSIEPERGRDGVGDDEADAPTGGS